ncbi:MAG: homoserine dehydrogenase, partial [Corynebacterium variabile]
MAELNTESTTPTVGVALLGMGTVGREVLRILGEAEQDFTARIDGRLEVRGVA